MTNIRLRRQAPEAQGADACTLCGARKGPQDVQDNLIVGTPGTSSQGGGAVCAACGRALHRAVEKFGSHLDVSVEQSQRTASDREITTPRGERDGFDS